MSCGFLLNCHSFVSLIHSLHSYFFGGFWVFKLEPSSLSNTQVVLDNPTCFTNPFQFEITFECLQELDDDLEWKVLYVGSATDSSRDQILDEILVGPVPVGINKFVLQADAPDPTQLSQEDLLGVTVVLVTCSYKEREFVRVGYYVNNEYHDPNAPPPPQPSQPAAAGSTTQQADDEAQQLPVVPNPVPLEHIQRQILADKPRVTKFPISWGDEQQQEQENNLGLQDQSMMMNDDDDPYLEDTVDDNVVIGDSASASNTPFNGSIVMGNNDNGGGNVVSPYGNITETSGDGVSAIGRGGVVDMQEESNLSQGSHFGTTVASSSMISAAGGADPMNE